MNIPGSTVLALVLLLLATAILSANYWAPLGRDGLHDPANPSLSVLQEPAEALGVLPLDLAGNMVNWVEALEQGLIEPRTSLYNEREPEILDTTVLMKNTNEMAHVTFPHRPHTQWMSCEACHDSIFVAEIDANPINMGKILDGEYCGICHGAVSFPLTECDRCHNTEKTEPVADAPEGTERGE